MMPVLSRPWLQCTMIGRLSSLEKTRSARAIGRFDCDQHDDIVSTQPQIDAGDPWRAHERQHAHVCLEDQVRACGACMYGHAKPDHITLGLWYTRHLGLLSRGQSAVCCKLTASIMQRSGCKQEVASAVTHQVQQLPVQHVKGQHIIVANQRLDQCLGVFTLERRKGRAQADAPRHVGIDTKLHPCRQEVNCVEGCRV